MSVSPTVSVVVPAYNAQATLDETLTSIFAQTMSDLEVLVVEDGSKDGTWELLQQWQIAEPQRLHALQHPGGVNCGVAASRNLALDRAQGKFIAFIDADDAWLPHKLEKQLQAFEDLPENVGVVFADSWYVRLCAGQDWEAGEKWLHPRSGELSFRFHGQATSSAEQLLFEPHGEFHNWVMSPTPLVRSSLFASGLRFVGPPRLNTQFEDYLMWLMLSLRCEFVAIQEPLAYYRIHDTQFISRYVRQARCLHYLKATRELLDILQQECQDEIARRGWRQRIDRRFAEVAGALLSRYRPAASATIGQVPWVDVLPLLRFAQQHGMLMPVLEALVTRVQGSLRHRLTANRLSNLWRRIFS